jgi:hypothetical protein
MSFSISPFSRKGRDWLIAFIAMKTMIISLQLKSKLQKKSGFQTGKTEPTLKIWRGSTVMSYCLTPNHRSNLGYEQVSDTESLRSCADCIGSTKMIGWRNGNLSSYTGEWNEMAENNGQSEKHFQ